MTTEELPRPSARGNYRAAVMDGHVVRTSGIGPVDPSTASGFSHAGRLGAELDAAEGSAAARQAARAALGAAVQLLDGLDDVVTVVSMRGFLMTTSTFTEHAAVMDGASDELERLLGDRAGHVRTSIGVNSLPFGVPVVIELVVKGSAAGR